MTNSGDNPSWEYAHPTQGRGNDKPAFSSSHLPDRYLDLGVIDRGGMGEILRLKDVHMQREVACKINYRNDHARFEREIHTLAALSHPNIVPIYDIGTSAKGEEYYTMKLVRGSSLKEILQKLAQHDAQALKTYTRERLLKIFIAVCHAVEFAHQHGILHRDLKPANIMIEGESEALVCDWGIAKRQEACEPNAPPTSAAQSAAPDSHLELTKPGAFLGTLLYASPEQLAGQSKNIGPASDVYSLGVILHEILFGGCPYKGRDAVEVLNNIKQQRRVSSAADVTPELKAVVEKAIAYQPEMRYPRVSSLIQDIENYLTYRPVSVWHDPWPLRLRKWSHQHPVWTSSLLVVSIMLTVLAYFGYQWKIEKQYNYLTDILIKGMRRVNAGVRDQTIIVPLIKPLLQSKIPFFQREAGKIFFSIGDLKQAAKHYEKAKRLYRDWQHDDLQLVVYWLELGWINWSYRDQLDQKLFLDLLMATGDQGGRAFAEAIYYRHHSKDSPSELARQIELFTLALRSYPEIAISYYFRGLAYHKLYNQDKYQNIEFRDKARIDYTQALRLAPNHADIYFNRYFIHLACRQYAEANQDLDMALQNRPESEHHPYYRYKVDVLFKLERGREALKFVELTEKFLAGDDSPENIENLLTVYQIRLAIFRQSPPDREHLQAAGYTESEEEQRILYQQIRLHMAQNKPDQARALLDRLSPEYRQKAHLDHLLAPLWK